MKKEEKESLFKSQKSLLFEQKKPTMQSHSILS